MSDPMTTTQAPEAGWLRKTIDRCAERTRIRQTVEAAMYAAADGDLNAAVVRALSVPVNGQGSGKCETCGGTGSITTVADELDECPACHGGTKPNPHSAERIAQQAPISDDTQGGALAFAEAAEKARTFARCYPEASDGRNTFVLFAEWAAEKARTASSVGTEKPS